MKNRFLLISLAALMTPGFLTDSTLAQATAQERAANLRQQLVEVQAKQTELEARLQQLEEDLKPENIEKTLAGVGSTKPEEVREQRRRQLEIEKKSVQTRLEQLATSRTRLETGILQAAAAAYHSSANPSAAGAEKDVTAKSTSAQPTAAQPPTVERRRRRPTSKNKSRSRTTRRRG